MKNPKIPSINPIMGEPVMYKQFDSFKRALFMGLSKRLNTPVENILWEYRSDCVIDKICDDLKNNIYTKTIDKFSRFLLLDSKNGEA